MKNLFYHDGLRWLPVGLVPANTVQALLNAIHEHASGVRTEHGFHFSTFMLGQWMATALDLRNVKRIATQ